MGRTTEQFQKKEGFNALKIFQKKSQSLPQEVQKKSHYGFGKIYKYSISDSETWHLYLHIFILCLINSTSTNKHFHNK